MITLRKHVFLCYTLRVVWCVLVVAEEWTVTIPNQISGLKGSCILIPCSFTHPSTYNPTNVTWYQYSKLPGKYPVVFSRTKPGDIIEHYSGRTELVGRASDGDCSLMINGMILEHNGEDIYPWVDEVSKSVFAFFQWRVTLEVTDTAPRPQLSVSEEQREGGNITVSCAVLHTCPSSPPSLSFGDQRGVVQGYHTEEIQGRWRVLSTISFVARAEDHEKVVACNVTHPGGQTAAGEVVLDVSYAPAILPLSFCSVNDGEARCECVVDSHPVAQIIWTPWSIQDNQTHNITDLLNWRILRSILIGPKVDDMGDVLCNSTNEHGSAFLKLPFIAGETSAQRSLFYGGVVGALLLVLSFASFLFWRFYSTKRDCRVALEEVELKGALQVIHNDPTDCPGNTLTLMVSDEDFHSNVYDTGYRVQV
ncbi:unnamed protein product [Oncorhynchus mykiss]|uniref:Ig-like domain-containing protein n=1 Tax=Oncorhynchus mykiss TaxID=8022 RepID=A0A060W0H2_ONCMY|nr:unnamed protein product [Oncorhynchus mykiss]